MPKKPYHHGDLKNALVSAGASVLAKDGVGGFSLRKVARKAGVSHAAPYAHFADKQALLAAISTEGFKRLYAAMDSAIEPFEGNPLGKLAVGAWTYVEFALQDPDQFKITFSGVLEKEKEYPAFVEISQQTFHRVVAIVEECQRAGILRESRPDLMAVTIWGQVHGLVSLLLEGQISHTLLDRHSVKELLVWALDQLTLVQIPQNIIDELKTPS
jgi:AcrR family transcriptional regulator